MSVCVIRNLGQSTILGHSGALWRPFTRTASPVWLQLSPRGLATSGQPKKLVEITSERLENFNIQTLSLNRPPVNSFNTPLSLELASAIREAETTCDGVIIKSSLNGTFSAGLDLNDLYQVPEEHLRTFWKHVQNFWYCLYSSRLPTIAAINGHCLAAGTIVAAACDYRIAVSERSPAEGSRDQYRIGVTAAKIGLVAPPWFLKMLTYLMGQRDTELYLQQGMVFTPFEAQSVGLVDKVCHPKDLESECKKALLPFLEVSQDSRSVMKASLREDLLRSYLQSTEEDMENFVSFVLSDSVQNQLGKYIEKLKRK